MQVFTLPPILERIEGAIVREEMMTGRLVTHVVLDKHEWEEFTGNNPSGHEIIELGGKRYSVIKEGYWCV